MTYAQAGAGDFASISAIVDLPSTVVELASEAILNNADGTYGGEHNFYIYDQGSAGFVYLPNDTDSTFDWMAMFDVTPADDHPIYYWASRAAPKPLRRGRWLAAMNDPAPGRSTSTRSPPAREVERVECRAGSTPGRSRSPPT